MVPGLRNVIADKAALRIEARKCRAAAFKANHYHPISEDGIDDFIAWLAGHDDISTIAAYWPINDEFDCRELLIKLERCGYELALPVITGPGLPLEFHAWVYGDTLKHGPFGTQQPEANGAPITPDVVLTPLLAFDNVGHRLGYGGGYYDRTLSHLRAQKPVYAIGVAFQSQEVDQIPASAQDARMDGVLTETGLRLFEKCGQ